MGAMVIVFSFLPESLPVLCDKKPLGSEKSIVNQLRRRARSALWKDCAASDDYQADQTDRFAVHLVPVVAASISGSAPHGTTIGDIGTTASGRTD